MSEVPSGSFATGSTGVFPYEETLKADGTFRTYLDRMEAISDSRNFHDLVMREIINNEFGNIQQKFISVHELLKKLHENWRKNVEDVVRQNTSQQKELQELRRSHAMVLSSIKNIQEECLKTLEAKDREIQLKVESLADRTLALSCDMVATKKLMEYLPSKGAWHLGHQEERDFDRKIEETVNRAKASILGTIDQRLENQKNMRQRRNTRNDAVAHASVRREPPCAIKTSGTAYQDLNCSDTAWS